MLAWPHDQPPQRSLELARSLADAYEAELAICCLGNGAVEAQAAAGLESVSVPVLVVAEEPAR